MVRLVRDEEIRPALDLPSIVARVEMGYLADGRGEVVPFPRSRIDARGTTLAWLGAALPSEGVLGYRSYLYASDGRDRGDQVVALYGHQEMELRAIFLGRLVGNLRTGAAVAAALHLADPSIRAIGILGTGSQARNALSCIAAVYPSPRVVVWSPNHDRRESFREWSKANLHLAVEVGRSPADVLERCPAVALVTSSETPVVTPEMVREPRLLVSINAYRRPEIDPRLLDATPQVWTDSVTQAASGSLFASEPRRSKLRPLAHGLRDGSLRNTDATRIVINTGAAWEEVALAQLLFEIAEQRGVGVSIELSATTPAGPELPTV
jgi:alanine dehydrogenase